MLGAKTQVQRTVIGRMGLAKIEMYIADPSVCPVMPRARCGCSLGRRHDVGSGDWRPTIMAPTLPRGAASPGSGPSQEVNDGDP